MTPVPDLIAQWHAKMLGGGALMRGLVAWDAWEVPISKAAATTALVENALPSIQLSTAKDGKIDLLLFSSPDAYEKFKVVFADTRHHLMKLPGFERKLRVALDWALDLFFPRDIVYLRPLHTSRGPAAVPSEGECDSSSCSTAPPAQGLTKLEGVLQ